MNDAQSPLQCIVYNQYTATNIAKLVQGLCGISKGYNDVTHKLLEEYYNINTATASRLDTFGKLLNFNRYITFSDPLDLLIPTSPGIDEYEVIIEPDFKKCRLQDDSYRRVLKVLFQTRNTVSSVRTLSKVISDAVDADVFVDDRLDMRYITYYFRDRIPGFLEVCIKNFDILPRPAGMATQYISAISRFLGFLIQVPKEDRESTARIVSAFWKARFPEINKGVATVPYELQSLRLPPYQFTTITEEDWTAWERGWREAAENDYNIDRINNELEKYVATQQTNDLRALLSWRQYLAAPTFEPYTQLIKSTVGDYNEEELKKKMQAIHKGVMQAAERTRTLQRYQYRLSQISKHPHNYDPRKDLIYDPQSRWYYYKKEQNDTFLPEFISSIYEDNCGTWYLQTNFVSQMVSGNDLELRDSHYGDDHNIKTLPIDTASPLIQRYRPLFLRLLYAPQDNNNGVTVPQDTIIIEIGSMMELMHDCVKRWQKAARINEQSFRACLDFEYRACSLIQHANMLHSNGHIYKNEYYKYIYDSIKKYYGDSNNYNAFWNDYDTNSPAYKRRQFLRTQRYIVENTRNWLQDQYYTMQQKIDTLKGYMSSGLQRTLRTELELLQYLLSSITILKKDLERTFYNDIELGKIGEFKTNNDPWYNQVTNTNRKIQEDYDYNTRLIGSKTRMAAIYDQASDSCGNLGYRCSTRGNTYGMTHDSVWCHLKSTGVPDSLDTSSTPPWDYKKPGDPDYSWDELPDYDYWNMEGGKWWCKENRTHSSKIAQKERANNYRAAIPSLQTKLRNAQMELQIRTLVTKERTLNDVMHYYNKYRPSVWPPPEVSKEEEDTMLLDWTVPPYPAHTGALAFPVDV